MGAYGGNLFRGFVRVMPSVAGISPSIKLRRRAPAPLSSDGGRDPPLRIEILSSNVISLASVRQ
jgi:hypothetical protein